MTLSSENQVLQKKQFSFSKEVKKNLQQIILHPTADYMFSEQNQKADNQRPKLKLIEAGGVPPLISKALEKT